jgi:hypothetical protein
VESNSINHNGGECAHPRWHPTWLPLPQLSVPACPSSLIGCSVHLLNN